MTDHEDPDLSALYKRTPRHEPGTASDHLIRAAAHAAVSKPRRQRQLIAPWAVAATLVLSVGIGWQVFHEPAPEGIPATDSQLPMLEAADEMPASERVHDRAPPPAAPTQTSTEAAKAAPAQAAPRAGQVLSEGFSAGSKQSLSIDSAQQPMSRPPLPSANVLQRSLTAGFARSAATADCDAPMPDDEATQKQWDEAFAAARRDNDDALLLCLRQLYERRFGRPYPSIDGDETTRPDAR